MTSDVVDEARDTFTAYGLPQGRYTAHRTHGPGRFATLGVWVLGMVLAMMALSLVSVEVSRSPNYYSCPPDCGGPPTGLPVATNPRFTAPDGSFSVSYPTPDSAYRITTDATGVTAEWTAGDGGTMRFFSVPAAGRTARQIADALMADEFPDAETAYELPNAILGYQPGYGRVADDWPKGTTNDAKRLRVIVIVAVKDDLGLVAGAVGPFHQFGPDFGPGPPSPANLQIAQDMGKYVNSFTWREDPPR